MRTWQLTDYESEIRLFILLLLVFLIISPWGSLYLVQRTKLALAQELDQNLISVAELINLKISRRDVESVNRGEISYDDFLALQATLRQLVSNSGAERGLFLNRDRRILLDSQTIDTYGREFYFEGTGEPSPTSAVWFNSGVGGTSLRSYLLPVVKGGFPPVFLLVQKESRYLHTLGRLVGFDLGMKIGGVSILLLIGFLFTRSVLKPYRRIRETAKEVGRVRRGEDETQFMERTFRETVDKLRELASLGEMSAGIAHEFRNSLASIMGYAQLLKRGEATDEIAGKIVGQCHRFRSLLDEFLRFAKPAELRFEPLDVREVLRESVSSAEVDRLSVSLEFEPRIPVVRGDRLLLRQVFLNLIQNSQEATPEGGNLTISAKGERDRVEISFRDTGRGIPSQDLSKVFTPFFSTKEDGIGLGLSLVRKIVTAHGGGVRIHSREGEGTEVLISLPRSKRAESL